jgi:hypothetical protein
VITIFKIFKTYHQIFLSEFFFSSPGQRQSQLLQSLGVRRPLTFNQKQELPVVAMFVNGSKINEQSL